MLASARPAALARAEWDGRTARPAWTLSRCARVLAWGIPQGEKTPFPSGATLTGALPATHAWPRRPSARASNPQASQHPCPRVVLTRCLHLGPESLLDPHQALRVFPFPLFHSRGERGGEGGKGGGEAGESAVTAPRR
jgi:hypothetical protein